MFIWLRVSTETGVWLGWDLFSRILPTVQIYITYGEKAWDLFLIAYVYIHICTYKVGMPGNKAS